MIAAVLAGGRSRRMGAPIVALGCDRTEPFPAQLRGALEREEGMRRGLEGLAPTTIEWDAAAVRSIGTLEELERG